MCAPSPKRAPDQIRFGCRNITPPFKKACPQALSKPKEREAYSPSGLQSYYLTLRPI